MKFLEVPYGVKNSREYELVTPYIHKLYLSVTNHPIFKHDYTIVLASKINLYTDVCYYFRKDGGVWRVYVDSDCHVLDWFTTMNDCIIYCLKHFYINYIKCYLKGVL